MSTLYIPLLIIILFAGGLVGAMFGSYLTASFELSSGHLLLGGVAFIGLAAPIYNSWLARCHNRLQIRPLLSYQTWVVGGDKNEFSYTITIKNNGFGPAIIDNCEYTHNGNNYEAAFDLSKAIIDSIKPNLKLAFNYHETVNNFILNDIIGANETHVVIKCSVTTHQNINNPSDLWNRVNSVIQNEINKVVICISYKCGYNTSNKIELKPTKL